MTRGGELVSGAAGSGSDMAKGGSEACAKTGAGSRKRRGLGPTLGKYPGKAASIGSVAPINKMQHNWVVIGQLATSFPVIVFKASSKELA